MRKIEMIRSVDSIMSRVTCIHDYIFKAIQALHPDIPQWLSQKSKVLLPSNDKISFVIPAGADELLYYLECFPDLKQLGEDYNALVDALDGNKQFAQELKQIDGYSSEIKDFAFNLYACILYYADFSDDKTSIQTHKLASLLGDTFSEICRNYKYWAKSCDIIPAGTPTDDCNPTETTTVENDVTDGSKATEASTAIMPHTNEQQKKPQKGKQIVPFSTLNDDGGYRLKALKEAMKGKKGKGAALIMHCAMKLGWTNTIEFGSVKNLMGEVYFGVESGYTRYKTKADFTNTEITDTMKCLNQLYYNLKQGK